MVEPESETSGKETPKQVNPEKEARDNVSRCPPAGDPADAADAEGRQRGGLRLPRPLSRRHQPAVEPYGYVSYPNLLFTLAISHPFLLRCLVLVPYNEFRPSQWSDPASAHIVSSLVFFRNCSSSSSSTKHTNADG